MSRLADDNADGEDDDDTADTDEVATDEQPLQSGQGEDLGTAQPDAAASGSAHQQAQPANTDGKGDGPGEGRVSKYRDKTREAISQLHRHRSESDAHKRLWYISYVHPAVAEAAIETLSSPSHPATLRSESTTTGAEAATTPKGSRTAAAAAAAAAAGVDGSFGGDNRDSAIVGEQKPLDATHSRGKGSTSGAGLDSHAATTTAEASSRHPSASTASSSVATAAATTERNAENPEKVAHAAAAATARAMAAAAAQVKQYGVVNPPPESARHRQHGHSRRHHHGHHRETYSRSQRQGSNSSRQRPHTTGSLR